MNAAPLIRVRVCPACGGSGRGIYTQLLDRLHQTDGRWDVARCVLCSTMWLDPRPADDVLGEFYPPGYFTHNGPIERVWMSQTAQPRWKNWARHHVLATCRGYAFKGGPSGPTTVGLLLSLIPGVRRRAFQNLGPLMLSNQASRRLLDVGAGNGAYLAKMRDLGWDVHGQDIDVEAARAAASVGIDVVTTPLNEIARLEPDFDVVTASHVIEHVPDPVALLQSMAKCLRPGGLLVVVTPNACSLGSRVFSADWYPLDPPRHLAVYSARGLRVAALRCTELRSERVSSTAQIAFKVFRLGDEVRGQGKFHTGTPMSPAARLTGRAFGALEWAATQFVHVGEELVLTAVRRS